MTIGEMRNKPTMKDNYAACRKIVKKKPIYKVCLRFSICYTFVSENPTSVSDFYGTNSP